MITSINRDTYMAYAILADVRPLFGCESCGTQAFGLDQLGG